MVFVIKPSFVTHLDDKARPTSIFSCDISPDGARLATAALDQKIKIWNTKPILDEDSENTENDKKLLSTLSSHNGVVLCVRWSPDGRYLASGSDDYIVIVWERDEFAAGRKVFGQTEENHETWTPVRRLTGHENDVNSIAWSGDGYLMATGGVDNTIIVWDADTFERVKIIRYHQGNVKGLAFDPTSELLASQSDDRSVCIWNTTTWSLVARIQEPLQDAPNASFFQRLSWSPEGTFLALPNTVNNGVYVASILKRGNWNGTSSVGTSLVGHDNVVDVALFNPTSFVKDPSKPAIGANMCAVVAVAARSTVSIWLTSQTRPVVVFDTIVDRDVLDLSWTGDGTTLYACSSDGHVAVMQFSRGELCNPASTEAQQDFLRTWRFGRPPRNDSAAFTGGLTGTASAPNMLVARKGGRARFGLSRASSVLLPIPPPGAPQEITIVNGKRRIRPAFLGMGSVVPMTSNSNTCAATSQPPIANRAQSNGIFQPPLQPQHETYLHGQAATHPWFNSGGTPGNPSQRTSLQDVGVPSWGAPQERPVLTAQQGTRKRRAAEMDYPEENEPMPQLTSIRPSGRTLGGDRPVEAYNGELVDLYPAYIPATRVTVPSTEMALAVPVVKMYHKVIWDVDADTAESLEYRNFSGQTRPSEIVCRDAAGKVQWLDYCPSNIIAACFTPTFSSIACVDKSVQVYSTTGRRLLPKMILDAACSFLDAYGQYLLALTASGMLSVWDIEKRKAYITSVDTTALTISYSRRSSTARGVIASAKVRSNGAPVISLSTGSTYTYDNELATWTELLSSWWSRGSEFWETSGRVRGSTVAAGRGPVKLLEAETTDWISAIDNADKGKGKDRGAPGVENIDEAEAADADMILSGDPESDVNVGNDDDWKTALSLGHLESRLQAASVLGSLPEYRSFLALYAKKLGEEAFKGKAEELCKELIGPIYHKTSRESPWDAHVLGMHKHVLLKEILNVFAKTKNLSRLSSEYSDLLKRISSD